MKKLLFVFLFIVGCSSQVPVSPIKPYIASTPRFGVDVLILGKQDCKMIGQELDAGSALGVLDDYIDPLPCVNYLVSIDKVTTVRVHLGDGTASNHTCGPRQHDLNYLTTKVKKWAAYASLHPTVKFYMSPWLEHGCRDATLVSRWFSEINRDFPGATPVCSSIVGGCPHTVKLEGHGQTPRADIISHDGFDGFQTINMGNWLKGGNELSLFWTPCMNGRLTSEKPGMPVPPPLQRKNWCLRDEIQQAVRLLRPPETKPIVVNCMDILAPNISKIRSENYGITNPDRRQNKPMLILKNKYNRMSIQTLKGKEIGCFQYYGPYIKGGFRYYEGNCSNKNPVQLMDLLGSRWGKVVSGRDCYIWNSIERLGAPQR